ncbi:hypothetical protein I8H84_00955 [Candidatus Saccharibacteria bacterium]|nr:hypothetical protein [Candidatus Saccharibacteria bacterium]MBH1972515.1 hypothetical protein [Candidatus Saccharibacteria bacterium]MBH1990717.1 hypothetical protein [Candidatus Saccharibacteria bacterium]
MSKVDVDEFQIDNEEILSDPEGFVDKFDLSIFDEKARSAMNLAREIEQDSLTMMEKGFSMARQIYEAELATNDHLTGLTKFFISLSATSIFAAVGLNVVAIPAYLLYILATPVLVGSVMFLVALLKRRNKIIKKRADDYSKINESMEAVVAASKMRLKAMRSIAEDDPRKMQDMFQELGFDLTKTPVNLRKEK